MQTNSPVAEVDDWDQHWKQFGESSEMGPTPRYRSRLIRSMMNFPPPGNGVRFLEIGSGTGAFAEYFCSTYPQACYVGLELSKEGVDLSRQRVPRAQFVQAQPTRTRSFRRILRLSGNARALLGSIGASGKPGRASPQRLSVSETGVSAHCDCPRWANECFLQAHRTPKALLTAPVVRPSRSRWI